MSTPSLTPFESHYASSSKAVSTVASSPPASSDMPESKDEHEEEDEEEEELSDEDKRKWQQLLVYIEKAALYSKMLDEQMSKAKSNYSSQQSAQKSTAPTAPVGKMPKFEVQRDKLSRKPKSKGAIASTKSKSRKRVIEVSDGSDVEHDAKRARLDDSVSEEPTGAFRQPALVTGARLKEYQLEGVAWMVALFQNGLSGILADEMGLGKTLQTIAFHAYLRERTPAPFLVVCPLSVLHNWIDEFKKFAPDIPTCMYHGTPEERAYIRKHEMVVRKDDREKYWLGGSVPRTKATPKRKQGRPPRKYKVESDEEDEPELPPNQQTTFPVVITTYEMIIKDRVHFMNYRWGFIVVDEGHRLKNMDCKLVREIKQIPAEARMVLTGTPLQNNLAELWSLLNFVLPSIFTDLDTFQDWFNQPTAQGSIGSSHTSRVIHSLHTILRPFLLRRVKADVETGLPPKKEYVLYAPISERQRELYDAIVQGGLRALLLREQGAAKKQNVIEILSSDEENDEGEKDVDETPKKKGKQIASRTRSKHAGKEEAKRRRYNLDGGGDREYWRKLQSGDLEADRQKQKEKSVQELGQEWRYKSQLKVVNNMRLQNTVMQLRKVCSHPFLFDWPVDAKTNEYVINEELVTASGKMMVLERLLDELFQRGHKVLLFSQFTTMLDIIEDWATEFKEWPICRIDGSTKMDDRRNEVRRFQESGDDPDAPKLFLLSTRAGGLGLNLVAADTVIFYDQDWNPQMDIQAQDRAHRIGQTKPVLIFRLVSAHTVETKIMERATDKRKLEALVIAKGKFKSTTFTDSSSTSSSHHVPKKVRQETMAELAASLLRLEGEKIQVVTSKGRAGVLSDGDLEMLLDRSPEVFLDRQKGWNSNTKLVGGVKGSRGVKDEKAAFAVYEAPRDEGNDALARMMGEDIVD